MIQLKPLRHIVRSQEEELSTGDDGIPREREKDLLLDLPHALVVSGVRRCGKSTLLRQLQKKVGGCFFNFEDPRIAGFELRDFSRLEEALEQEHGRHDQYFFDEIQVVPRWELFVRSLLDRKRHVVITGSNASLLSKELGTRLTGRHLRYELFPFSFAEFLTFTGREPGTGAFDHYLREGGFPEYLAAKTPEILRELLNDVVVRDVAVRYGIRNVRKLREMALFLITNVGKEFSYTSLKKTFDLGSTNSAVSFISFFEDSYLLFTVPRFAYSLKRQLINPKKAYAIDTGLATVVSAAFSPDKGRMLENLAFLGLRRRYQDIFYFRERGECDFLVKEGARITQAVQVCWEVDEDTSPREIGGLVEALETVGLREGLILTYDQEDVLRVGGKTVRLMPLWKWLLGTGDTKKPPRRAKRSNR